jgi:hypothetical protein
MGNFYANPATTFSPSTLPFGGSGLPGNGKPDSRGGIRFTQMSKRCSLDPDSFNFPEFLYP